MNANISLINEIYSKCLNQQQDILDKINEIHNGIHDIAIDRIKQKIIEKLENFDNSLKLGDKIISELNSENSIKWRK